MCDYVCLAMFVLCHWEEGEREREGEEEREGGRERKGREGERRVPCLRAGTLLQAAAEARKAAVRERIRGEIKELERRCDAGGNLQSGGDDDGGDDGGGRRRGIGKEPVDGGSGRESGGEGEDGGADDDEAEFRYDAVTQ